jgi:hypothetical protein
MLTLPLDLASFLERELREAADQTGCRTLYLDADRLRDRIALQAEPRGNPAPGTPHAS